MGRLKTSLTVYFFALSTSLPLALSQQCYFPDGSLSDQIPCDTGLEPTWCCDPGFACLSNGLCLDRSNSFTGASDYNSLSNLFDRGSCTDKTWKSPNCISQCSSIAPDFGAQVWSCEGKNGVNDYTSYCCDKYPREPFQNDCCADTIQNPRFTLEKPTIINYTPPPNPTKTDGPGKSGYYGPLRDTTRSGYYRGGRETTRTVVPIGSLTSTTESGSTLALPTEVSSSATTSGNGTVTSATSSPISTGAASKIGSGIRPYQQIAVGVVAALGVQMFV